MARLDIAAIRVTLARRAIADILGHLERQGILATRAIQGQADILATAAILVRLAIRERLATVATQVFLALRATVATLVSAESRDLAGTRELQEPVARPAIRATLAILEPAGLQGTLATPAILELRAFQATVATQVTREPLGTAASEHQAIVAILAILGLQDIQATLE